VRELRDLRVLVVEDEFLLALALQEDLATAGFLIAGPYTKLAAAIEASRRERFDVAVLDVNLNGERIYPLADELLERKIPFVLLTGYGAADLPERFRRLPRLPKPYEMSNLLSEVRRAAFARQADC
jgi:DNA-binding response OmpR family regulator